MGELPSDGKFTGSEPMRRQFRPKSIWDVAEGTLSDPAVAATCTCNSVTFSLASACAYCQEGQQERYPHDIPEGTAVPAWAFLPVNNHIDYWELSRAKISSDERLPDTIGTATIVPSSTSSLAVSMSTSAQPEGLPTSSSPVTPIPKPGPSHTKGVVGGVIGACIGLIIITSAIFLCRRRYRKKQVHRNPSLAIQTHEHYEVKCVATPSTSDVFFPPPLHGCDPFKAEPRSSVSESVSRSFEECEIADNQYFGKVPRFQRVPTLMSV
ncbi:hypothetical protein NLI96_g3364 [Meripilus lineatus]|uniref:Uncharacterized protein n=1 Tax=Meripilus lineatus TaxID=2056292 RepID=A0AAD5V6W1_9APHY|nr:hypothetical protein NLI96_g3364 [Physisporinus lineatus]